MKSKFTFWNVLFLFIVTLSFSQVVSAQTTGDYRTNFVGSVGQWSNVAIWQRYDGTNWVAAPSTPTSSDGIITISAGDSVQIQSFSPTIDQVVVESTASLIIFNSTTTLANGTGDDIIVNGKFYVASSANLTGTGTVLVNAAGFMQVRNSGSLSVNTNNTGSFEFNNTANIAGGSTFTNNSTVTWVSGDININGGSSFVNNDSISVTGTLNQQFVGVAGNLVTNALEAVLNKTGTSGACVLDIPFTNNGTIKGKGTYIFKNTSFINTGIIAPGSSAGVLTLDLTPPNNPITAGNTLQIEILSSLTPGTGHDQLVIDNGGGITALNGTLQIIDNAAAPVGVYTILTATGNISGTFATVNKPGFYSNPVYDYVNGAVTIEKLFPTPPESPLPVVWGGFSALAKNKTVELSFSTLQEENTSHFVIEHSENGHQFSNIGTIPAKGNSSVISNYKFTHTTPNLTGNNFYRILQVDQDDKATYSIIRNVLFDGEAVVSVQATPNPVRGMLQFNVQTTDIRVMLHDMNGRPLRNWQLQPGQQQFNVQDLPSGTYQLIIYKKLQKIGSQRLIKL